MRISAVITAHNEGDEAANTVESIRRTSSDRVEVVLVDDASTDGCCDGVTVDHVIRHDERRGVAPSRLTGAAVAGGDCYVFMDSHHRFSDGCLDQISQVAVERNAITTPCVGGFDFKKPMRGHGFYLSESRDTDKKRGVVGVHWISSNPRDNLTRCYGANVPYAIPASVWDKVKWSAVSYGYGGNEASVAVRAYFAEVDTLHVCGPWARHLYRKEHESPFPHGQPEWWHNHALTCRICFSEQTWRRYWWPNVFTGKINPDAMERPEVIAEHEAFQSVKRRSDESFFRGLLHVPAPEGATS